MTNQLPSLASYQKYQPHMNLSDDQKLALAKIGQWYDLNIFEEQPFTLTGGAGTGKSSLMPEVVNMLNISESRILIITSSEFIGRKMQTRFPKAEYRTIASLTKTYGIGYDIQIGALNHSNKVYTCDDLEELKRNLTYIFRNQPKVAKKFPFASQQKIIQFINHSITEEHDAQSHGRKYNFDTRSLNQLISKLGHYKTIHEFIIKTEHFTPRTDDAKLITWAQLVIVDEVGMISNPDLLKGLSAFDQQNYLRSGYKQEQKELGNVVPTKTLYAKYPPEYNTPILLLGDKGQLFPPGDDHGNQYINPRTALPDNISSELTTNHRQVGGNGFKLAELSKAIRSNPYNLETLFSKRKTEPNIAFINLNQPGVANQKATQIKNSLLNADYALTGTNENVYRLNLLMRITKFRQQHPNQTFTINDYDRLMVGDTIRVNQTEKPGSLSLRKDEKDLDATKFDYQKVGGIPINDMGEQPDDNGFYFRRLGFKNGQSFIVKKIYTLDEVNQAFNKAQRKLLNYDHVYQQGLRLIDVEVTDLHLNTDEEDDNHVIKKIWVNTKYMFDPTIKANTLKNQSTTKDLPDEIITFMHGLVKLPDKVRNQVMNYNHRTCLYITFNYAMTVYKAQGTERDNVVYFARNASYNGKRTDYTAATRAKENLIIINANNDFPFQKESTFKTVMQQLERQNMKSKP